MKSESDVHERIALLCQQLDYLKGEEFMDSEFNAYRILMIAKVQGKLEDLRWVVDQPLLEP